MKKNKSYKLLSAFCLLPFSLFAQYTEADIHNYIETYKEIAISKMVEYKIPASITLAQGIFESASGTSRLATEANNHFGIKCHKEWTGNTIYIDDDETNECFRRYSNVEDSFIDHSNFLTSRPRYAELFTLEITDYKGWSYGLKKAGYATNPQYAEKLIELIERYNLNKYDYPDNNDIIAVAEKIEIREPIFEINNNKTPASHSDDNVSITINNQTFNGHKISIHNQVPHIIIESDANIKTIAKEMNLMVLQINFYNDLSGRTELKKGEIIYLKKKQTKACEGNEYHIVEKGETLQLISQLYAIKLNSLCNKNKFSKDFQPPIGTKIYLRRKK